MCSFSSASLIFAALSSLFPRYSTDPIRGRSLTATRTMTPCSPLSASMRMSSNSPVCQRLRKFFWMRSGLYGSPGDADGVAGDGGVAGGFESLDRLTGEAAGARTDRRRGRYRRFGDDAAGLASRDDRSGFRPGRWLLLLRSLRGGGSAEHRRQSNREKSSHTRRIPAVRRSGRRKSHAARTQQKRGAF